MESTEDNFNGKSEFYCPHYERDTCLIHFKCCTEEDWYPCHKCHNESVALIQNDKTEGPNVKPLKHTAIERSEITKERSSSEVEVNNGLQVHEDVPTSHGMEEIENPVAKTSDDRATNNHKSERQETGFDGNGDVKTGEEISASYVPKDPPSPLTTETKTKHAVATALDGIRLRCTGSKCRHEQEFSQKCESCGKSFAFYFCEKCKLLIEKKVDAYHCDDCGICRGNKTDHFHCHVCNICMAQSLKEKHKCFEDRGHDPCAICYEEVFSGAIIFPCFHMVHKDCAERLVLSGSQTCPMCRSQIFQNGEDHVAAEESSQQNPSNPWLPISFSKFYSGTMTAVKGCFAKVWNKVSRTSNVNTSSDRAVEMNNFSQDNS